MSDVDIIIRNAIYDLISSGREVSVATVQEALQHDPFLVEKGIVPVPSEWIEPILTEEGGPWPEYKGRASQ